MKVSKELLFTNNEEKILQLVPDYSVPRYTSYPTAPNFHDKINNDTYESWLKKLDKNEKIKKQLVSRNGDYLVAIVQPFDH